MTISNAGIQFDGNGCLLEWGKPVEVLAADYGALVEKQGTIYVAYWGEHAFIRGSGINLGTRFRPGTLFTELEYSVSGDTVAMRTHEIITNVFTGQFGAPTPDPRNSDILVWHAGYAKITLLFEDFRGLRLHLTIKHHPL